MSVVNLGIKDVGKFEFRLVFNNEGRALVESDSELDLGMLVLTLRHGILGVPLGSRVGVVG